MIDSNYIRKSFLKYVNNNYQCNGQINYTNLKKDLIRFTSYYSLLLSNVSMQDVNMLNVFSYMSLIQMYTDYYRVSNYFDKEKASKFGVDELKYEIYEEELLKKMLSALKIFYDASGYFKILINKKTDQFDNEYLSFLNPLYNEERKKLNVTLDLNFINRHIEKWQKSFPNNINLSFDESAKFIMNLYKISKKDAENVLKELFKSDIKIINYKRIVPNSIIIGNYIVTEENLKHMLRDNYQKNHILIKKRENDDIK